MKGFLGCFMVSLKWISNLSLRWYFDKSASSCSLSSWFVIDGMNVSPFCKSCFWIVVRWKLSARLMTSSPGVWAPWGVVMLWGCLSLNKGSSVEASSQQSPWSSEGYLVRCESPGRGVGEYGLCSSRCIHLIV